MMEKLVHDLATLQEEYKAAETVADNASSKVDGMIEVLRMKITEYEDDRKKMRWPHENTLTRIEARIEDVEAQIAKEWDGEKKTIQYDAGTLKFRTTNTLLIGDRASLLNRLLAHFSTEELVETYIIGFSRTAVRKFIALHPQPYDVVELVPRTTVKLEALSISCKPDEHILAPRIESG